MIEQLIARVFHTRNIAHLEHWHTTSAAIHKYTGEAYDDIIPLIDTFVEAYQAAFDVVGEIPAPDKSWESKSTELALTEHIRWINDHRSELCQNIAALENLLDNLSSRMLQLVFTLKRLR